MTQMSLYQQVIHQTRYARWNEEDGRREYWSETPQRYVDFFVEHLEENYDYKLPKKVVKEVYDAIHGLDVMPSMRTLMTAGKALKSAEVANYNCAYLVVDSVKAFSEHMFVLMCGSGSGFSVERRFTDKLPEVPHELHPTDTTIVVSDSRKGWCVSLNQFINLLYAGSIPQWDTTKVRSEGARLKTFGGYSSGPKVLEELFAHIIAVFKEARGRKLRPIEVFSIMCYIAQIVVVGGVRRSATIALFDKDDAEMRAAKSGSWWVQNPHYAMANISAVFESKPRSLEFMDIWRDLVASGSGEPGILNRQALWQDAERIGRVCTDKYGARIPFGVNPCSEISLRPYEFCNLTGAAIRPGDSLETIKNKVRIATIIGTWQATISDFDYLRKIWSDNVNDERLLGVCLAGIMDHEVLSTQSEEPQAWLEELREHAWEVNKEWAKKLGINTTASVTAIKPAGNCRTWDSIVTTSDGIHTMEDYALGLVTGGKTTRGDVVGFNVNDVAGVVEIKTNYGMSLKSTQNHRWMTQRGMVRAYDLNPGDEIITEVGAYNKETHAELRSLPIEALRTRYKQTSAAKFPSHMDEDLAWLIGYLWGDGSMSINGYRLRFIDQYEDHLIKAQRIIRDKFGLVAEVVRLTDRDAYILEVGNKHVWHWLIANGVVKYAYQGAKELEPIPRAVRTSTRSDIIAFLGGLLDADGFARDEKAGITNSKDIFSSVFQQIALSVGLIFGRSLNTHGENLQDKKHMWLCTLSPKSDENAVGELRKHSCKIAKSKFGKRRDQRQPSFKVKTVTPIGYEPVYDVTTTTGEYLSGAFVSHNSGELYDVSSGIHPRYAPYYIRTIRQSNGDPMTQFLKDNDIPWEVSQQNPRDVVFSFPVKSPEGAICASDLTAIQQLEHWLHFKRHYATHTISCTIYVRDNEWPQVGAWVYEHFDEITGLSFLPYDDHTYAQAPYQPITKEKYEEISANFPKEIDWSLLAHYEGGNDTTTVSQEYACVSGACSLT